VSFQGPGQFGQCVNLLAFMLHELLEVTALIRLMSASSWSDPALEPLQFSVRGW
jgi:hypothetical protein